MKATTIGIDLAKTVFQIDGGDGHGKPVLRKRLGDRRSWNSFSSYRSV